MHKNVISHKTDLANRTQGYVNQFKINLKNQNTATVKIYLSAMKNGLAYVQVSSIKKKQKTAIKPIIHAH